MPTDQNLDTTTASDLKRLESGLDNLETGGRQKASAKSYFARLLSPLIAIAVIIAMIFFRGQLQNQFSNIGNNLT